MTTCTSSISSYEERIVFANVSACSSCIRSQSATAAHTGISFFHTVSSRLSSSSLSLFCLQISVALPLSLLRVCFVSNTQIYWIIWVFSVVTHENNLEFLFSMNGNSDMIDISIRIRIHLIFWNYARVDATFKMYVRSYKDHMSFVSCYTYNSVKHTDFHYSPFMEPYSTVPLWICDVRHGMTCLRWPFRMIRIQGGARRIGHSAVWWHIELCVYGFFLRFKFAMATSFSSPSSWPLMS